MNEPKILGLTGGIGSGKTTIARLFAQHFAIPIYIADERAKHLIATDEALQKEIIQLLGKGAFENGIYNRAFVRERVFADKALLHRLNAIVHPAVQRDFEQWHKAQKAPYVIREAAILFESNSHKNCHWVLTITAPLADKIARIMKRDALNQAQIRSRMQAQWNDEQRVALSQFVIENTTMEENLEKIREVHFKILKILNNPQ